jgi:hypothetical protein
VRALRSLLLAGVLLGAVAVPASADVDPVAGSGGVGISVSTAGGPGISTSGAGGRTCRWTVTQANEPEPFKSIWAKVPPPAGEMATSGEWARWDCSDGTAGIAWMPNNRPVVAAAVLARVAYRYLPLPAPAIRTNPAAGHDQLVNLPTWLWVDRQTWGIRAATASVPGLAATATAVPITVTWTMGDGNQVICHGPGVPYDMAQPPEHQRTNCSYTYRNSSAGRPGDQYVVSATTTWSISWTAIGAAGGGTLPALLRTSSTTVRVAEAQAIN